MSHSNPLSHGAGNTATKMKRTERTGRRDKDKREERREGGQNERRRRKEEKVKGREKGGGGRLFVFPTLIP